MRTLQFASFAAAALISGPILAQANPTAEAQLNGGFLGQQNDRLNKGMNANDPFTARASDALAANDYAKALAILRPYRSEASLSYYYLSGRANEGLGDYAAARKNLPLRSKSGAPSRRPKLHSLCWRQGMATRALPLACFRN